ncbi:MAG: 6-phosphogluconolactonase [Armatimonadetes bacterium]|nr:6-phosphogluconolactonase [Armatimonadota bacterium]
MERQIIIARDADDQNRQAVEIILARAKEAIAERGRFTITLCGGHSISKVYELLASHARIDWTKVFLFWGDERYVDRTNPYSNYKLVHEALISKVTRLPRDNVFAVPVEEATPTRGARVYAKAIQDFFRLKDDELPRFDLCLNGMGPDGHTASLFPRKAAVRNTQDIAVSTHAGLPPWVDRVTLTLPVFNNARTLLVISSGCGKAQRLRTALEEEPRPRSTPVQGLQPTDGELIWLLEPQIASKLAQPVQS